MNVKCPICKKKKVANPNNSYRVKMWKEHRVWVCNNCGKELILDKIEEFETKNAS